MKRLFALPALAIALGCATKPPPDFWLLLATAPGSGVRLAETVVRPPEALLERHAERGGIALRLRRDLGPLEVSAPGGCPIVLEAPRASSVLERAIEPLFDLGPSVRVVGAERRFEIRATASCEVEKSANVELRVDKGAPLGDVRIGDGGRSLSATTRLPELSGGRGTFGIVPVSAAERGATEIVARTRLGDGTSFERRLEVAALSRASGLPSVATGHSVLLAGTALRLDERPEGSRAELRRVGELTELVLDRPGKFKIAEMPGRTLDIDSLRYDEMPLDCGRSDCHAAIAENVRDSPMTFALAADLGGRHPLGEPECALACHATGEPGTDDGGFSHVARELGVTRLPETFAELPRALRRLGGVGCLACHGPAAIPPESARWAVLRSDVCAVCHDAPPGYAHVAALGATRMATADRDPRTRENAECARCHTTYGALETPARKPPAGAEPVGIACAACHEVHAHGAPGSSATAPALLRDAGKNALPGAPAAARGASRVCIACHSPGSKKFPDASAAALWAGLGGVDPKTGAPLEGPAPHASDPRGCLRCHDSGPEKLGRGASHAFQAGPESCKPCHAERPKRRPELAAAAKKIVEAILPHAPKRTSSEPAHAGVLPAGLSPERMLRLRNALLVLEDPAADVHNPVYAARLVEVSP
ncbi:MAG TPA: hypothetical protein VF103_05655 [Polyangiaceae bacterium]